MFEYLGLPGVGKTWILFNGSLTKNKSVITHSIPLGGGKNKLINTLAGIIFNPKLFIYLLRLSLKHKNEMPDNFIFRPYLVIFERYGRVLRLCFGSKNEIHVDEGSYQFIWRVFSELELNEKNIDDFKKVIKIFNHSKSKIIYIGSSKHINLKRIIERGKVESNFDLNVINNKLVNYTLGRSWMSLLILELRKLNILNYYNNEQA
jgi:hypothetical protein|tara:strand:- start:1263 stop:1877 length:615 start_codon:yes stop_codon:yes gene_type:complete